MSCWDAASSGALVLAGVIYESYTYPHMSYVPMNPLGYIIK